MNEYLKILREISKLWKNGKFDNGSMLIKKYGYENVRSAIQYCRQENLIGTHLTILRDGEFKGKMVQTGYEKIPYYPLTQSGIDIITPEWEKNFKLVKSEFLKECVKLIVPAMYGFIIYSIGPYIWVLLDLFFLNWGIKLL